MKSSVNPWARSDGYRRVRTGITGEGSSQDEEGYDELQTYFCQLYPNLLTRIEKILTA